MDAPAKIIKPQKITKGSLIALIAPAGPVKQEQVEKAQKTLSEMGYRSCYTESILSQKGYLAGDDDVRLNDFHQAFKRKDVDAIICIRGGYGTSRIVDKIDYNLIKQNPKIFVGYSDITVLLNAIYQQTGLVTFHGIVGISAFTEYTRNLFISLLSSVASSFNISTENKDSIQCIFPGHATGKLAGGNLSLVAGLLGTKYQIDFSNKLAFLEDIGEAPYKIDRMLTQLLLSGSLHKASGIILGAFTDCDIDNNQITNENSLSLLEVFRDRLGHLKIPIISGFSFGHIKNQAVFPIGIEAKMDTGSENITLLEPAVY